MKANVILIHPRDNVTIALENIGKGETVTLGDGRSFSALFDIPYCHKVALSDLACGAEIIKYGEIIGQAKEEIRRGGWIHSHNLDIGSETGTRV